MIAMIGGLIFIVLALVIAIVTVVSEDHKEKIEEKQIPARNESARLLRSVIDAEPLELVRESLTRAYEDQYGPRDKEAEDRENPPPKTSTNTGREMWAFVRK